MPQYLFSDFQNFSDYWQEVGEKVEKCQIQQKLKFPVVKGRKVSKS